MSTTVTGNIKDLSTAAVSTNCFLRFILRGLNGNIPRVSGTALIANGTQGAGLAWVYDFVPNASGAISGTLYSTRDAAGTGNGEIEAGGSLTAVWYGMVLYNNGVQGPEIPVHAKNGVSLDPSSVTPITTTPVSTAPTGDTTYLRLDGGNNPMTGQLAVKNGAVGSPGLTFASSLTTGFWQQAADVIGVSIAGALKWLINATGLLFGSGQAIGWSSNSDPSAAGGDIFLNRQAANKAGLGTTASAKDGILLLSKVAAGGTEATGSTAGDATAARSSTSGAAYLGTDGNGFLFRNGNAVTLSGTSLTWTFPSITDTLAGKITTDTFKNKTLQGASSGNAVTLLDFQGPAGAITGTGAAATVYTYTIPANTIGAGKGIRYTVAFNHSTGTASVSYGVSLGGTAIAAYSSAATGYGKVVIDIFNNAGVTNAQSIDNGHMIVGTTVITGGGGTSAKDTTTNLALVFTFNVPNTDQVTPVMERAELIQ